MWQKGLVPSPASDAGVEPWRKLLLQLVELGREKEWGLKRLHAKVKDVPNGEAHAEVYKQRPAIAAGAV